MPACVAGGPRAQLTDDARPQVCVCPAPRPSLHRGRVGLVSEWGEATVTFCTLVCESSTATGLRWPSVF